MQNKLENELYLDFSDVLIKPRLSSHESRSLIELRRDLSFNKKHTISWENKTSKSYFKDWKPIPVMSANMDTVTNIEVAYELVKKNMIAVLHKYVSKEDISKLFDRIENFNKVNSDTIDFRNIFISRGTSDNDKLKLKERLEKEPRIKSVCIDVANGYRTSVFEYIDSLRSGLCKDKILMVGNVATNDAIIKYAKLDVDIIKCGIGPGSVCTTRVQTGVGVPQISVILNGVEALKDYPETYLCSDGGCKVNGDIAKAFCAGADFVMIGGMLAGHEESPGDREYINQKIYKRFSGMAAKESQWDGVPSHGVEEGKTVYIPYRGMIADTLNGIMGGLRSTCTYTNSSDILELIRNGKLIRTTVQENKVFNNI